MLEKLAPQQIAVPPIHAGNGCLVPGDDITVPGHIAMFADSAYGENKPPRTTPTVTRVRSFRDRILRPEKCAYWNDEVNSVDSF